VTAAHRAPLPMTGEPKNKIACKAAGLVLVIREGFCVPKPFKLRSIACGLHAISPPTDGRRGYQPREFAAALNVGDTSVYRWIKRGLLRADTSAGFMVIPTDEALRFSREGPRRDSARRLTGAPP
jgi:hypothetical protein